MKLISNSLVMYNRDYEHHWLEKKCQEVNIRLYRKNTQYRDMISGVIAYMCQTMSEKFDDYNTLQGISGANIGIPLNIIVIRVKADKMFVMINPLIREHSREKRTVKSNCGSLCLGETIEVERSKWVKVSYHNTRATRITKKFQDVQASTIQHEIDHNKGILITKRHWNLVKKQKKLEKENKN